jgi:hypothetical protein
MPFTNTTNQSITKKAFGKVAWTPPATLHIGLSTATVKRKKGSTASHYWTITEPSGSGYARVPVANSTTKWSATTTEPTTGYTMVNHTTITFPSPTGSWGTCTYVIVMSTATGLTLCIAYAALTVAKAIGSGDTPPTFAAKSLKFTNN